MTHSIRIIAVIATLIVAIATYARDFEYQGLTYTVISESDKTCQTKVGYLGDDWNWHPGNDISGELVIPSTVSDGAAHYTVIKIGAQSFSYCNNLTDVTIPNSVTEIDDRAFLYCYGIKSVRISSVEAWCRIKFYGQDSNPLRFAENLYLNGELVRDLVIPSSITKIYDYAFCGYFKLNSLTIPNSITQIGKDAFTINTTSVHISSIETWCGIKFTNDSSNPLSNTQQLYINGEFIQDIVIPNSITKINSYAFSGYRQMTSITIPNSITAIGENAFAGCSGLTAVHINSLDAWCRIEFKSNPLNCANNLYLNGELVQDLVIPNSITKINDNTFPSCLSLTSVTIPESVTEIGYSAFGWCTALTDIIIPNSVNRISAFAFHDCSRLKGIKLPDSITTIEDNTFLNCSSLIHINIPNSVTQIGNGAFWGCSQLANADIPNSVTYIGPNAFYGCNMLTSINIPPYVTVINDNTFAGCTNLTTINLNPSITHIGNTAFAECSSLTQIDIPESVLHIGIAAFSSCHQLKSANLPPNITEISDYIFCACSQLNGIHIPESVTKIGLGAFTGCSSLTSINIPASVTEIDLFAFDECTALTAVHAESVESWCKIDFYEKESNPLSNAHNMYVNGELIHNLIIPNSITQINDHAFAEFSSMTSIEIPNSVTQIGKEAFGGCSDLISVTIPGSVTTIGTNAFLYCNHMTQLTIGNSVSEIQNGAFSYCPELTDIYSLNTTPPNIYEYTFDEESNAILHIKPEALNAYRAHAYWRRFKIMADLSSGINEITDNNTFNESTLPVFYYNLHGQSVDPDNLHPGQLYIRRQGNKSTKIIAR